MSTQGKHFRQTNIDRRLQTFLPIGTGKMLYQNSTTRTSGQQLLHSWPEPHKDLGEGNFPIWSVYRHFCASGTQGGIVTLEQTTRRKTVTPKRNSARESGFSGQAICTRPLAGFKNSNRSFHRLWVGLKDIKQTKERKKGSGKCTL